MPNPPDNLKQSSPVKVKQGLRDRVRRDLLEVADLQDIEEKLKEVSARVSHSSPAAIFSDDDAESAPPSR